MSAPLARVEGFPAPDGALDLGFHAGEAVLLEGPNGSGKTSILRSLAGLDAPLAPRRVEVRGDDPRALPAARLPALVGLVPQDPRDVLTGLTIEGEFRLRTRPMPEAFASRRHQDIATLSSGEARRVGLALPHETAPVLLLDEPVEGLDATGRGALVALVDRVREGGGLVVMSDHAGLLGRQATRRVGLSEAIPPTARRLPQGASELVLRAAPALHPHQPGVRFPTLELPAGFHVLSGPNGAGKTTRLRQIAGLNGRPALIGGREAAAGRDLRFLPARARDLFTKPSVAAELARADAEVADTLVRRELRGAHPLALSGGEAQRVALAKTLGVRAPCYLLDEPEAHLDAEGRAAMLDIIAKRIIEGACVVAATHDEPLAALAHTRLRMEAPT